MTQPSNVTMQQKLDAVERLTLIEKLEQEKDLWDGVYIACDLDRQEIRVMIDDAINGCIDIVKQHSGWISADERLPNEDGKYLVYCVGNRELTKDRKELSIMRFNQKTKGGWFALSPLFKVIYWQQIQPPSEVQDD